MQQNLGQTQWGFDCEDVIGFTGIQTTLTRQVKKDLAKQNFENLNFHDKISTESSVQSKMLIYATLPQAEGYATITEKIDDNKYVLKMRFSGQTECAHADEVSLRVRIRLQEMGENKSTAI